MQDIAQTLYFLANSFDLKQWQAMGECLADTIECDYRDLRGTVETCTRDDYVALRKKALGPLKTQHLFSNLVIEQDGDNATCQLSALIMRSNDDGERFDTHAMYDYCLMKQKDRWLITAIKQTVLWNQGDSTIHEGVVA